MKTLFLAWRDPYSRSWYPVGRLNVVEQGYRFVYLKGVQSALNAGFCLFPSFPNVNSTYVSSDLFPLFANRVMPHSRPDYASYTEWLSVAEHKDDPIALLARSGGQRATDTLEVFPCPEPDARGQYHIHFFAHGLRHMPKSSLERAESLQHGDQLLLMSDFQNPHDPKALLLRTSDKSPSDVYNMGYCPRYLVDDVFQLLERNKLPLAGAITVVVERVNHAPAPTQFRLLCSMTMRWPDGFPPFSTDVYQPYAQPTDA